MSVSCRCTALCLKTPYTNKITYSTRQKKTPRLKNCILFEYPGEYRRVMGFVGIPPYQCTGKKKIPPHFFKNSIWTSEEFHFWTSVQFYIHTLPILFFGVCQEYASMPNYRPLSEGDNALGSVHLSVCLCSHGCTVWPTILIFGFAECSKEE